jgi:hypothetical protein
MSVTNLRQLIDALMLFVNEKMPMLPALAAPPHSLQAITEAYEILSDGGYASPRLMSHGMYISG